MADYFAVLTRTLSGFKEPSVDLRGKLYDRARSTISSQLQKRQPPLSDAVVDAEMAKLEDAIERIEADYEVIAVANEPDVEPEFDEPVAEARPEPEPEPEPGPTETEPVPDIDHAPEAPDDAPVFDSSESSLVEEPAADDLAEPADAPQYDPVAVDVPERDDLEPEAIEVSSEEMSGASAEAAEDDAALLEQQARVTGDDASEATDELVGDAVSDDTDPARPASFPRTAGDDPIAAWAAEFLTEPASSATDGRDAATSATMQPPSFDAAIAAAAAADAQPVLSEPRDVNPDDAALFEQVGREPAVAPSVSAVTTAEGSPPPAWDAPGLAIPPAPSFGRPQRKKRSWLGWLIVLLLLGGLVAAAIWAWSEPRFETQRNQLIEQLGLSELLEVENTTPPTPVKTIPIAPPEPQPQPEPAPAAEVDTPAAAPAEPLPKREERLTETGEEAAPVPPPVVEPPVVDEPAVEEPAVEEPAVEEPATQGAADPGTLTPADTAVAQPVIPDAVPAPDPVAPAETVEVAPATEGPAAILYEEGGAAGQNTLDSGNVAWTLGSAASDTGVSEPFIEGRVEIPGRGLVLLMSIKRNTDPALPASHLIEVVFAVPDDFSGGAVQDIARIVLKETEQGRGENLVAVPARLGDGIFLIALNNLPEARTTNETLLKNRGWIDLPMQYRTGRRALITMEKGTAGTAVFDEAFAAWAALDGT